MKVFAATIDHKGGVNLYLAESEELLTAEIAGFVDYWWEHELADMEKPTDTLEMIETYFEQIDSEYLNRFGETEVTQANPSEA